MDEIVDYPNGAIANTIAGDPATDVEHARNVEALPPGAIVPRHGKGWLKPGTPGMKSRNPSGVGGGNYHECVSLARLNAPAAMRRLVELSSSDDERIAYIASTAIVERAWGRAAEFRPIAKANSTFDLSRLSLSGLRALMSVLESARVPEEAEGSMVGADDVSSSV